ncbi:hypothetical protein JCM11641_006416 [Rhodosporidiobolus odoratus]
MNNLGNALHALLSRLRALPSTSPPHLQRLAIRLSRAYITAQAASPDANGLELLVRLRSRLQELVEELDEGDSARLSKADDLRREAQAALEALQSQMQTATGAAMSAATSAGGHSRTPSVDLPRRLPLSSTSSSVVNPDPGPAATELDAFLSRALSAVPPPPNLAQEHARSLSEAYALFLLSSSPSSVLPAGQTLSSIFQSSSGSSSQPQSEAPTLEKRIETQLREAYFDEFEAILSPSSVSTYSEKHDAWIRLAANLTVTAVPLIPSRMRTPAGASQRVELETSLKADLSPIPGGSFNCPAALTRVQEVVSLLQRLCAPARDAQVRQLLAAISSALLPSGSSGLSSTSSPSLVSLVRRTLVLAGEMTQDVSRFKRGLVEKWASEEDLRDVVTEEGMVRERKVVEEMYGGSEGVRRETKTWVGRRLGRSRVVGDRLVGEQEVVTTEAFAAALVETLFTTTSVSLPPYPPVSTPSPASSTSSAEPEAVPSANSLPPPLLVLAPTLFHLQNLLQALVILSCLIALIGPSSTTREGTEKEDNLVRRLWALLETSIEPPTSPFVRPPAAPFEEEGTETRLANLADELVAYRVSLLSTAPSPSNPISSTSSPPHRLSAEEEQRLRASVDRLLRYEDPVFGLLQKRLQEGIKGFLVSSFTSSSSTSEQTSSSSAAPPTLRTGRTLPSSISHPASASSPNTSATPTMPSIKGFDRPPLLANKVEEVVRSTLVGGEKGVWNWVEGCWGGVLGWTGEAERA